MGACTAFVSAFVSAKKDLWELFSGLGVVDVSPSTSVVVSSVPSQYQADPPICAALMFSA